MVLVLVGLVVSGLVIGALGRLVAPGPNPIGCGGTILAGLVGAAVGGLATTALFGTGHGFVALIAEVLVAALCVSVLTRARFGTRIHR